MFLQTIPQTAWWDSKFYTQSQLIHVKSKHSEWPKIPLVHVFHKSSCQHIGRPFFSYWKDPRIQVVFSVVAEMWITSLIIRDVLNFHSLWISNLEPEFRRGETGRQPDSWMVPLSNLDQNISELQTLSALLRCKPFVFPPLLSSSLCRLVIVVVFLLVLPFPAAMTAAPPSFHPFGAGVWAQRGLRRMVFWARSFLKPCLLVKKTMNPELCMRQAFPALVI